MSWDLTRESRRLETTGPGVVPTQGKEMGECAPFGSLAELASWNMGKHSYSMLGGRRVCRLGLGLAREQLKDERVEESPRESETGFLCACVALLSFSSILGTSCIFQSVHQDTFVYKKDSPKRH